MLRHAAPERVELLLDYRDDATVLTVSDHGALPAAVRGGVTGRRLRAHRHARARGAARRAAGGGAHPRRLSRGALVAGVTQTVRVLLADDQRLVRESLATMLGLLEGIELAATASNGEEAVELAAKLSPDVVLMDLRMPRLDGIEATRRLRERDPDAA